MLTLGGPAAEDFPLPLIQGPPGSYPLVRTRSHTSTVEDSGTAKFHKHLNVISAPNIGWVAGVREREAYLW